PSAAFSSITQEITHFIGVCDSKVFFLGKRLGICSIKFLEGEQPGFRHVNHCFIPNDWRNRQDTKNSRQQKERHSARKNRRGGCCEACCGI
ncbi:hypothetical protein QBC46DRAFT_436709, partial [Diplogelasinospora grovesii]